MNLELLFYLLVPLFFFLSSQIVFRKFKFFQKFDLGEKIIFNLATSFSFLTIALSFYGYIFKYGFRTFSIFLFVIGLISCLFYFKKSGIRPQKFIKLFRSIIKGGDWLEKVLFWTITLFFLKLCLFALFKPIIDPDLINTYLPYARSIFLADCIPEKNYYDNSIMVFPPVGGVTFFAWFYSITANIYSEIFRIFPIIIVLGIIIVVYKIFLKVSKQKIAQLATIIFLIIPFWDDYIFESLFYPDLVALFLFLVFLYFFLNSNLLINFKKTNIIYAIFIFSFLGTAVIFKVQYLIVYYYLILILLLNLLPKKWYSYLILLISICPIYYRFYKGVGYQLFNPLLVYIFFILIYFVLIFIFKRQKGNRVSFYLLFCLILGSIVPIFIYFRNIVNYGSFLSPVGQDYNRVSIILKDVSTRYLYDPKYLEWGIFLFPGFGQFWLIPKLFGIKNVLKDRKASLLMLFVIVWYAVITLLIAIPNIRSLFAIVPFLSLIIAFGIDKIRDKYKLNEINFIKSFIILSIFISLFYSTFLWWNGALLTMGSGNLRKTLNLATLDKKYNPLYLSDRSPLLKTSFIKNRLDSLIDKITDASLILTARGDFYSRNILKIACITLLTGMGIVIISYIITKRKIGLRFPLIISLSLIFFPHLLIFIMVSGGNLSEFKKIEQAEIYNYWGQEKYLIPYFKNNSDKEDKIITWSIPTGLSYFLNMRVYNLMYSYSLGHEFKDVYEMTNLDDIYNFYKKNKYKYFVINSYPETYRVFGIFNKSTNMFAIINNNKYTSLEVKPTEDNFWYVYKLK